MKKTAILLAAALIAGCNTTAPLQTNALPKGLLICPKETVEVCTGRTPKMMECQCVRKEILERELRRVIF